MPGATSSVDALVPSSFVLLVVMPGATSSFLRFLLLVAMPFVTSNFFAAEDLPIPPRPQVSALHRSRCGGCVEPYLFVAGNGGALRW